MPTAAYSETNKRFKSVSRILFGEEVGELADYSTWLNSDKRPVMIAKSCGNGASVKCFEPFPAKGAKVMALSEMDFAAKFPRLGEEELGTLGSIARAVAARAVYCGNSVLGNSAHVERCTGIVDSSFVYDTETMGFSKGIGCSCEGTYNESLFGCNGCGYATFSIRCFGYIKNTRCFEVSRSEFLSDCYYSHGLANCQDCIFCFGLKNRRHCVGNEQLSPEEYAVVKGRLQGEMRSIIAKEKKLPSLLEIVSREKPDYADARKAADGDSWAGNDDRAARDAAEREFSKAMKVVLGKEHVGIAKYETWLTGNLPILRAEKSCASGAGLLVPDYSIYHKFPKGRLVSERESEKLGKALSIGKDAALAITLAGAGKAISRIAYFTPEWHIGNMLGVVETPLSIDSTGSYRNVLVVESKNCGYSYIPRNSDSAYGCYYVRKSSFCIRCSHSVGLARCFEVDSSRNCSDCYFCHNCENVHESMFCFNAKNLKYAIGNANMPREEYMEVKARVLEEINSELARKNGMKINVLGLGI